MSLAVCPSVGNFGVVEFVDIMPAPCVDQLTLIGKSASLRKAADSLPPNAQRNWKATENRS